MAPRNKFTSEEMLRVAMQIIRKYGYNALTAQRIADALGTSTRPIFTCFETMEKVKAEVYAEALKVYDDYMNIGLKEKIPFFGVGMQYIRFAKEEPELYRFLFLTRTQDKEHSTMESMQHLQKMVRPTLMNIYRITAEEADCYFRDLWLVAHSLSILIVTGDCPYSDKEIGHILTRFSISICKSIKEIPGFAADTFDRDAAFRAIINQETNNCLLQSEEEAAETAADMTLLGIL